jgi:hypothetical protein
MDTSRTDRLVSEAWDGDIVPQLVEYIRIPNKSPMFDADWQKHGHMDAATDMLADWARKQQIKGMKVEVVRLEGRTPLIFVEIDGQGDDCVLLYGHLDKQPEMTGWADDLGPGSRCSRATSSSAVAAPTTLRDLRLDDGDPRAAGTRPAARALRDPDRSLRGVRQLRPALLRRPPGRTHRQAFAGRVPGLGLRQLRPAVVHHLAARPGRRQPARARAQRGRALRRRLRHRALELPHPAPVAVAPGGPGHGKIIIDQLHVEIPSSAWSRRAAPRRCWATTSSTSSPSCPA